MNFTHVFAHCLNWGKWSFTESRWYNLQSRKCESVSCSVVSDPLQPHGLAHRVPLSMEFFRQEYWIGLPFLSPGDLPHSGIKPMSPALQTDSLPYEPPGKPKMKLSVAQSCPTLCDPVDCSLPGSSAPWNSPGKNTGVGNHHLLQGSFRPRDWTWVSCIANGLLTVWVTREAEKQLLKQELPMLSHSWMIEKYYCSIWILRYTFFSIRNLRLTLFFSPCPGQDQNYYLFFPSYIFYICMIHG